MSDVTAQPTRDQLRALADRATPGPWEQVNDHRESRVVAVGGEHWLWIADTGAVDSSEAQKDAAFIAAARTAVPRLLDQLDQVETAVRRAHDRAYKADASWEDERDRADQAETRIQEVRAILDQHHDQTVDALWLDINDHIPGGDLGDPDMPCGRGVCALGDGHPGPCRC